MPDQVIFSAAYGSVLADAEVPCVIVQFHGFANSTQFKQVMDTGLAYYEAHNSAAQPWGWVGDTRQMGAIPKDVQHWLVNDWNLRAYTAGIREISVVVSENVFGQLATQQYAQTTLAPPQPYELVPAYYPTLDAARQGARQALGR